MKRKAGAFMLLAALGGGCQSLDGPSTAAPNMIGSARPRPVPGVQGPYGEPVNAVAQARPAAPAMKSAEQSEVIQAGWGVKKGKTEGNPAPPPGAVAALGSLPGVPVGPGGAQAGGRTSVRFTGPAGMKIAWFAPYAPGANGGFSPPQVEVPGRYNFVQGGVYRVKLTDIPNRPALELYPTIEIKPTSVRTAEFLAHSAVPVSFTEEDFEQVAAGNLVVKVVYLPDPQFQDLAVAGPDEIVSSRLEPGVDPIMEAQRRGAILLVIRIGNIDLEAPNTPAMNQPPQGAPFSGMPLMAPPGGAMPGQVPAQVPGQLPQNIAPGMQPNRPMTAPTTPIPMTAKPASGGVNGNVQVDGFIGRMVK